MAVFVGPALGAAIGLFNGVLIAKLGLNSLITTLGVATVIVGAISWYTEGVSILSGIPSGLDGPGVGPMAGLPRPLYLLAAVALLVWYLLDHTPYGRYLQAVGSNPNAARLVGLNVSRISILSFVISGAHHRLRRRPPGRAGRRGESTDRIVRLRCRCWRLPSWV